VQQHFPKLHQRGAVVHRAAQVTLQFVRVPERGQHRDRAQAALLQVDAAALPGGAPCMLVDQILQRLREGRRASQRAVDEGIAHHLAAACFTRGAGA